MAALEEAGYQREDDGQALLRELVNSLSSGKLLLVPTDDVWHLDEEKREDFAIAKLDQLIELVVSIRTAWIDSPESAAARNVAGRRLGPLEGDMTEHESRTAAGYLLLSMSKEKRAEYDFCFQASGSRQFLFALVRQPSILKGEGLDKLLAEWAEIKKSTEYKAAVEQSKKRTQEQTQQMTELQNLRIRINRLGQQGQDTEYLRQELRDKEEKYERGKKRSLGLTTVPCSEPARRYVPMPRAASARRALRSIRWEINGIPPRPTRPVPRLDTDDIPPRPTRPVPHVFNWSHEITPELDVDWTLCPEDPAKELRLREERNVLIKEQLQLGKPVIYRSSGWSLYPRVWSNDLCSYDPVTSANEVRFGDIVFCQVQPGDRFFAHVVSRKWFENGEWYFKISNLRGRENGWCSIKHIYGRLVRAEH